MPTRWETFPVEVGGGLVDLLPPIQQGNKIPGSAIVLTNFEASLQGGYRRINGYIKFDEAVVPSADNSTPLLGVGFLDGEIIVPREGKIYSSTGSGWTEIATGRTQTTQHRYTTINLNGTRKIIGTDEDNYPYSWDGSTFVNLTGSTDIEGASHATQFKNHIFYAAGNSLVFSEPFDENGFSAAAGSGTIVLPNTITGMIVFRDRLFVFTETEIKVLAGSSVADFTLSSVSETVGCVGKDTIREVSGDVMFLAADGLRLLGATDRIGDFSNENASKNIQTLFNRFNSKYSTYASVTIRSKSQYRVFGFSSAESVISSEGFIGVQFETSNPNSFQWSTTSGLKVRSALSEVYQGDEFVYFISNTEYVYQMDVGQDFDGTAISAEYRTPFFSFGDPTIRKTVYSVRTYLESEGAVTGSLRLSFDQGSAVKNQPLGITLEDSGGLLWGQFNWDEADWASGAAQGSVRLPTVGAGNSVSVEYSFTENQAPFTLNTLFIEYSMEDRR